MVFTTKTLWSSYRKLAWVRFEPTTFDSVILKNLLKSLLRKVAKRCCHTANSESVYIYICVCVCVCVCVFVYIIHVCIYLRVYIYTHKYIHVYILSEFPVNHYLLATFLNKLFNKFSRITVAVFQYWKYSVNSYSSYIIRIHTYLYIYTQIYMYMYIYI